MPDHTVSERCRVLRRLAGQSAREMARIAGFPVASYWSSLEAQARDLRLSTARRITQTCGVTLDWLATGELPAFAAAPAIDPEADPEKAAELLRAALAARAANDNNAPDTGRVA